MGWREKHLHEHLSKWSLEGEWFDHACIGSIPDYLYEKIKWGSLDDWWIKS
jgi:hypothetical protein